MVSNLSTFDGTRREIRQTHVSRPETPGSHPRRQNVATLERIVGGALGLSLFGLAVTRKNLASGLVLGGAAAALLYRSTTGYCHAYGLLGINTAHRGSAHAEDYFNQGIHIEQTCHIARPVAELYNFWRDFGNLPRFMKFLKSVEPLSETRSRWTTAGPMGTEFSWVAEIIHDLPNELISWKSMPNADVDNSGTIQFKPRGATETEVKVSLDYIPPAGQVGHRIAQLFGRDPQSEIKGDLGRFKDLMETGTMP